MKIRLWLLPLLGIYLFLVSATPIKIVHKQTNKIQVAALTPVSSTTVQTQKLNIFQLIVKKLLRRKDKADVTKADNLATISLLLGITACLAILIGFSTAFAFLAAIPLGIAAIITGAKAARQGTTQPVVAKTGKWLGLGILIAAGVWLVLITIILTTGNFG